MEKICIKVRVLLHVSSLMVVLFSMFLVSQENLHYLSTEKHNPITTSLSYTMQKNCVQGLRLLHDVDTQIAVKMHEFIHNYFDQLIKLIDSTRANKGRCFLIGSGSSGRIAIDIAARYGKDNDVIGIIAGGDSAFIRAREGFEDSEVEGCAIIQEYNVTSRDLVILISASGSASFNVGCAVQARKVGATVCYFYNSIQVPKKTSDLFDQLGVIPILIDIGPQAITGSTRLQAATIARFALGTLFANEQQHALIEGLAIANQKIAENLETIASIIQLEHELFAHPESNFKRLKDETMQGYVTFMGDKIVLRDIVMDTVETAPTFSTNPVRMQCEIGKKKAEFQAYVVGVHDSVLAWQTLLGRNINKNDYEHALQFSFAQDFMYQRPLGQGSLLIGVAWQDPEPLREMFEQARQQNAKTVLILISDQEVINKSFDCDVELVLDNVPYDSMGLIAAITLKQVLNMISNGAMILLNKVRGNQMIDVNTSNNKLIDRAIRLTQEILADFGCASTYDGVARCMREVIGNKKSYEEKNMYTPSAVKIAVTMLYKNSSFEDAIILLRDHVESLEGICA